MAASNEQLSSQSPEQTPEEIVATFAPRVDSLIAQLGDNPKIGTDSYSLKNGGPTVEIGRSCSIEEDGGHVYEYSENVVATLPTGEQPLKLMGEVRIGKTAFGRSSTGELRLEPTQLTVHMDRMISAVETFAQQQTSLTNQASPTISFPSPLSSAA